MWPFFIHHHTTMRKTSLTIVLVTYICTFVCKKRPINCHGLRTKGLIEFLTSNILFFSLVITYFFFQVSSNLFFGKVYAICYVLQVTYLTMSVVGVHYWGQIILKLQLHCSATEVSWNIWILCSQLPIKLGLVKSKV